MASDEIVWQVLDQQFCSFKLKTTKGQNFCRNEYNVSGLCNRSSCPLANSRYATVRRNGETGRVYIYTRTAERAHLPARWWTSQVVSKDLGEALKQIDGLTQECGTTKFVRLACKRRLTRIRQVEMRTRKLKQLAVKGQMEVEVTRMGTKIRRREAGREAKALRVARVERAVERELLERLRSGAYGDAMLNVDEGIWQKVMNRMEQEQEKTEEEEGVAEMEREVEHERGEDLCEVYVDGDEDDEEDDFGESDESDSDKGIGNGSGTTEVMDMEDSVDWEEEVDDDKEVELGDVKAKKTGLRMQKPNKRIVAGGKRLYEFERGLKGSRKIRRKMNY